VHTDLSAWIIRLQSADSMRKVLASELSSEFTRTLLGLSADCTRTRNLKLAGCPAKKIPCPVHVESADSLNSPSSLCRVCMESVWNTRGTVKTSPWGHPLTLLHLLVSKIVCPRLIHPLGFSVQKC